MHYHNMAHNNLPYKTLLSASELALLYDIVMIRSISLYTPLWHRTKIPNVGPKSGRVWYITLDKNINMHKTRHLRGAWELMLRTHEESITSDVFSKKLQRQLLPLDLK